MILGSVAQVAEVAADDVPATSHPMPLVNVFRDDVVRPCADQRRGALRRALGGVRALPRAPDPGRGVSAAVSPTHERPDPAHRRRDRRGRRERPGVRRRGRPGAPRPHRRRRRARARLPARRRRGRARGGRRRRRGPRAAGATLSPLAGVPLALKDVLTQRGIPTTCGSRILEGWRPPYDATVTARLKAAGVVHPRQDQHGRVRDGLLHRALGVRARRTTRGTSSASPAVPAAARPRRSPRSRRRSRSAPTPVARSASRLRSPARSG